MAQASAVYKERERSLTAKHRRQTETEERETKRDRGKDRVASSFPVKNKQEICASVSLSVSRSAIFFSSVFIGLGSPESQPSVFFISIKLHLSLVDTLFSPAWASEEGNQWIYVVWVYSGSDWGSVEALHCICFRFFLLDSLCLLLLLYATLHSEPQYCEPTCFNAIEAKKDLLWSGVFRRLSHTKIFLSLHILKRGFHLRP
ncbi:hypothetical protein GmHk_10G030446 [Glycine max]|nr:hypothetical protein GmHk_10G030446 [Glycine max]